MTANTAMPGVIPDTTAREPQPSSPPLFAASVLMMPDYRAGNPYQSLLADSLRKLGARVSFPEGYRRVFPISRAVSRTPVDVLHLHWLTPYLKGRNLLTGAAYALKSLLDLVLVRRRGVRITWTVHNQVSHESRFPRMERLVQVCVARLSDGVIVHSESAARRLLDSKIVRTRARLHVVPHGHYASAYGTAVPKAEARRALDWEQDKLVFLYFGMVRPYKNVEGLLAAWRSLPELSARAELVIAGEAMDPSYARQIAQLAEGATGITLALRRIPDHEVHLYFSAADVTVLPFHRILTSGSLLLAMSFGKPVIAPRLETVVENLQGAGDLLYDVDNENGLRTALQRAASPGAGLDDISQQMAVLCAGLSWDSIAVLTANAYGGKAEA